MPNSSLFLRKNQVGGITIPVVTQYSKATVIRTVGHGHRNAGTDQWNGMESAETSPCVYAQLVFGTGGTSIQWRKNSLSINGVGRTGLVHAKERN